MNKKIFTVMSNMLFLCSMFTIGISVDTATASEEKISLQDVEHIFLKEENIYALSHKGYRIFRSHDFSEYRKHKLAHITMEVTPFGEKNTGNIEGLFFLSNTTEYREYPRKEGSGVDQNPNICTIGGIGLKSGYFCDLILNPNWMTEMEQGGTIVGSGKAGNMGKKGFDITFTIKAADKEETFMVRSSAIVTPDNLFEHQDHKKWATGFAKKPGYNKLNFSKNIIDNNYWKKLGFSNYPSVKFTQTSIDNVSIDPSGHILGTPTKPLNIEYEAKISEEYARDISIKSTLHIDTEDVFVLKEGKILLTAGQPTPKGFLLERNPNLVAKQYNFYDLQFSELGFAGKMKSTNQFNHGGDENLDKNILFDLLELSVDKKNINFKNNSSAPEEPGIYVYSLKIKDTEITMFLYVEVKAKNAKYPFLEDSLPPAIDGIDYYHILALGLNSEDILEHKSNTDLYFPLIKNSLEVSKCLRSNISESGQKVDWTNIPKNSYTIFLKENTSDIETNFEVPIINLLDLDNFKIQDKDSNAVFITIADQVSKILSEKNYEKFKLTTDDKNITISNNGKAVKKDGKYGFEINLKRNKGKISHVINNLQLKNSSFKDFKGVTYTNILVKDTAVKDPKFVIFPEQITEKEVYKLNDYMQQTAYEAVISVDSSTTKVVPGRNFPNYFLKISDVRDGKVTLTSEGTEHKYNFPVFELIPLDGKNPGKAQKFSASTLAVASESENGAETESKNGAEAKGKTETDSESTSKPGNESEGEVPVIPNTTPGAQASITESIGGEVSKNNNNAISGQEKTVNLRELIANSENIAENVISTDKHSSKGSLAISGISITALFATILASLLFSVGIMLYFLKKQKFFKN